jgi:serine O-acetyltransferase
LHRYTGKVSIPIFIRNILFNPGYKYTFALRVTRYLKNRGIYGLPLYIIFRILLNHYTYRYGISIPYNTTISPGFYIGHFGGIVVNHKTIIGKNCNISQGVTIGETYGGKTPGVPVLGDNVYIGPGAKIIGGITVGNNVAIGANCVLTKSVPDNAIVVGIPGEILSYNGSGKYINNKVI